MTIPAPGSRQSSARRPRDRCRCSSHQDGLLLSVLDLKTGKPLFPVREQPAPASDIPGEIAAATQPMPDKPPPFARQVFTDDDVTTISSAGP